ncbi:MAG: HpcH/HpaI aldolase/citrate lyase family protein [Vulcanimicrobiaceae bacterium]
MLDVTVLLFVPGDRPERFAKAVASGAAAAILDLEDAVAPAAKDAARVYVGTALRGGLDAFVRINPPRTPAGAADLVSLAGLHPHAIVVPKTESLEDLHALPEGVPAIALIETVRGIERVCELAHAPNVVALAFGAFDLCAELGALPVPEVLAPLRSAVVLAARGAGRLAIDTPFVQLDDEAGLAADAHRSIAFGFDGKLAIHPRQVAPVLAAFKPSAAEVERARAIVAAVEGGGVGVVGATMVDAPLLAAARRVIARARMES